MKLLKVILAVSALVLSMCACTLGSGTYNDAVEISLSDDKILVNGKKAGSFSQSAVYTANDVVYYESGKDFTYGEGDKTDSHEKSEADAHTVVHIAKAGTYRLSGKLSKGQIAVDLGKDADEDSDAVVTLILDGVDITCTVAPAVIFYNVYECGDSNEENATKDVDTSAAGANVIIADGSENTVNGSYVARIYDPETIVLSADGTKVEDAKKLHKYDAAFYSKRSMNVSGERDGSGVLNITAANEGLDTELHLTINGGNINIRSGNDGINTNEDGVSVTTVNGGCVNITVTGETGEGDGIDSNGWLVINGGTVTASACASSMDSGIDSDKGIHINGGTVIAGGNMLDQIENGGQNYAVFNFTGKQNASHPITLKNDNGKTVAEISLSNSYSILIYSATALKAGNYTLWQGETQLAGSANGSFGGMQGTMKFPENMTPPEGFENMRPEGGPPADMEPPVDGKFPEGMTPPERPQGERPNGGRFPNANFGGTADLTAVFEIKDGANTFSGVKVYE